MVDVKYAAYLHKQEMADIHKLHGSFGKRYQYSSYMRKIGATTENLELLTKKREEARLACQVLRAKPVRTQEEEAQLEEWHHLYWGCDTLSNEMKKHRQDLIRWGGKEAELDAYIKKDIEKREDEELTAELKNFGWFIVCISIVLAGFVFTLYKNPIDLSKVGFALPQLPGKESSVFEWLAIILMPFYSGMVIGGGMISFMFTQFIMKPFYYWEYLVFCSVIIIALGKLRRDHISWTSKTYITLHVLAGFSIQHFAFFTLEQKTTGVLLEDASQWMGTLIASVIAPFGFYILAAIIVYIQVMSILRSLASAVLGNK